MIDRLRMVQKDDARRIKSHDLRRTFATWVSEDGYDHRHVQVLLGHARPETTALYTRVHPGRIAATRSPYDKL